MKAVSHGPEIMHADSGTGEENGVPLWLSGFPPPLVHWGIQTRGGGWRGKEERQRGEGASRMLQENSWSGA